MYLDDKPTGIFINIDLSNKNDILELGLQFTLAACMMRLYLINFYIYYLVPKRKICNLFQLALSKAFTPSSRNLFFPELIETVPRSKYFSCCQSACNSHLTPSL